MPRPQAHGRPGTPVIPAGWDAAHAPVITATLDCTIQVGPVGTSTIYDRERHQSVTVPTPAVYEGPASISVDSQARAGDVAGDDVTTRAYLVELDRDHPGADLVDVDHVIWVTASPDPLLAPRDGQDRGAQLDVDAIDRGRRFGRILRATITDD